MYELYHFGFLKIEAVGFPGIYALVRLQLTLAGRMSLVFGDYLPQSSSGARTYEEGVT